MQVETAIKCRICRKESRKDVVALKQQAPFGRISFALVYHFVTGYEDVLESGPQFLCRSCSIDLSVAYDFRKKCLKSEQMYERNPTAPTKSQSGSTAVKQEKIEEESDEEMETEYLEPMMNDLVFVPEYEESLKNEDSDARDEETVSYGNDIKDERISEDDDEIELESRPSNKQKYKVPNLNEDTFECPFCPDILPSIGTIIEHIHYEHNGRKMTCDEPACPFLCELPFQLHKHKMKVHSENAVKPILCHFCEKFSGLGKALIQHCETAHFDKESKCPKDECQFKYFFPFQLEKHDKQVHKVKRKVGSMHKCLKCDSIFETRTRLNKHQHEVHNIELPPPQKAKPHLKETTLCPQCGKSLKVSSLAIHIQLVHEKFISGFFICDLCGNNYSTKISLTNHIKYAHTKRNPISCRYCPELFPNVGARRYHEVKVHTQDYKHVCSVCGLKCFSPQNLRDHTSVHTGEKNFECSICSMKFKRRTVLRNHLVTHSDKRPVPCTVCGSSFKTPKYLKSHMRVHEKFKQ